MPLSQENLLRRFDIVNTQGSEGSRRVCLGSHCRLLALRSTKSRLLKAALLRAYQLQFSICFNTHGISLLYDSIFPRVLPLEAMMSAFQIPVLTWNGIPRSRLRIMNF